MWDNDYKTGQVPYSIRVDISSNTSRPCVMYRSVGEWLNIIWNCGVFRSRGVRLNTTRPCARFCSRWRAVKSLLSHFLCRITFCWNNVKVSHFKISTRPSSKIITPSIRCILFKNLTQWRRKMFWSLKIEMKCQINMLLYLLLHCSAAMTMNDLCPIYTTFI